MSDQCLSRLDMTRMEPPNDSIPATSRSTRNPSIEEERASLVKEDDVSGSSTASHARPARMIRQNIGTGALALLTVLLPVYFLLFAMFALKHDHAALIPGSRPAWLLQAAKYGPTIFPIVFAAIIGQLMTVFASWKLERSVHIGLLEYLLASRSLASAVVSLARLRIFSIWTPFILAVWFLSPLGGQSALRSVASTIEYSLDSFDIAYMLYKNKTGDWLDQPPKYYEDFELGSYPAISNAAFQAALSSPGTIKNSSQDLYSNLKIPTLEPLLQQASIGDWYEVDMAKPASYAALLGLPTLGIPKGPNTTFLLETSYVVLDCDLNYYPVTYWWGYNTTTILRGNVSGLSHPLRTQTYISDEILESSLILQDYTTDHEREDTLPRMIGLQSASTVYGNKAFETAQASCNMTTTHVEAKVVCLGGPSNCAVIALRSREDPGWPSTATVLDVITATSTDENFFGALMTAILPASDPYTYTAFEQYLVTPDRPLQPGSNMGSPLARIGNRLFSERFAQLINTYLLASIAPYAVTGAVSEEPPSNASAMYQATMNHFQPVKGQVSSASVVLRCHKLWTLCLILVSTFLVFASVATFYLDLVRQGPMVLDDFVSSVRQSPYVQLANHNSMEDGADIARRARDVKVRVGDVRPDEEVGYIAVAALGDGQTVQRIQQGRLYA